MAVAQKQQLTNRQKELRLTYELEWLKCCASFVHFFFTYWWVVIPDKGRGRVEERELQRECGETLQNSVRLMILKSRQIGWSALVTGYLFWKSYFHEDKECMIISRREDPESYLIISNLKFAYSQLPLWMRRRGPQVLDERKSGIRFSNGSYVEADASKDSPARGRTLALLVLDEFGKFPNPEDAWGSALPATEWGQLICLGNANGYGTTFWKLCTDAKQGLTDFVYRFYPWWAVPGRSAEWRAKVTSSMKPSTAAAEYPDDDVTCWIAAGDPVYDTKTIESWATHPPLITSEFEGSAVLKRYSFPKEGRTYVGSIDIAVGGIQGDNSVITILDVESGEHMVTFRGKVDRKTLAARAVELAHEYNDCLLAPEMNVWGGPVLTELVEVWKYKKLYKRKTYEKGQTEPTEKLGWLTDRQSKALIVDGLWESINNGTLLTRDEDLFKEMISFRYLADGNMGGLPHDDELMAMAIVNRVRIEHPLSRAALAGPPPPQKPPSKWVEHDGTFFGKAFGDKTGTPKGRKEALKAKRQYLGESTGAMTFSMNRNRKNNAIYK